MSILTACANCAKKVSAPDDAQGKRVLCRSCRASLAPADGETVYREIERPGRRREQWSCPHCRSELAPSLAVEIDPFSSGAGVFFALLGVAGICLGFCMFPAGPWQLPVVVALLLLGLAWVGANFSRSRNWYCPACQKRIR